MVWYLLGSGVVWVATRYTSLVEWILAVICESFRNHYFATMAMFPELSVANELVGPTTMTCGWGISRVEPRTSQRFETLASTFRARGHQGVKGGNSFHDSLDRNCRC